MKVKYLGLFFLILLVLIETFSCASTKQAPPDTPPPPVSSPPVIEPAPPAWTESVIPPRPQVEELTQIDSPVLEEETVKVEEPIILTEVRDESYFLAQYAARLKEEIMALRDKAIALGAEYLAPDYLFEIDSAALDALALYEAEDYSSAIDSGTKVKEMYQILVVGVDAYRIRLAIDEGDFFRFDPLNIAATDELAFSGLDDFEAGNLASAARKANEVHARYTNSLNLAMEIAASEYYFVTDSDRPLPAQFTVRTWEHDRDCYWNIAGLPWVYNDPTLWVLLYNANIEKMVQQDNPDLIHPGMVLDIPSVRGETREGMWIDGPVYTALR